MMTCHNLIDLICVLFSKYKCVGQKLLVGYKKGFGIFCSCCNSEVTFLLLIFC